jgi:FtsZ-interacting cell division protein ZipA
MVMQLPAQEPPTIDLPAIDGADFKVVRFGAGAAIMLLVVLIAVGALLVRGVTLREQREQEMRAEILNRPTIAKANPEPDTNIFADENTSAPAQTSQPTPAAAPSRTEHRARIDRAYKSLDRDSIGEMRAFLFRYGNSQYARNSGYIRKIEATLSEVVAAQREASRLAKEAEQEEERTRRTQQQTVPWDMGVAPP